METVRVLADRADVLAVLSVLPHAKRRNGEFRDASLDATHDPLHQRTVVQNQIHCLDAVIIASSLSLRSDHLKDLTQSIKRRRSSSRAGRVVSTSKSDLEKGSFALSPSLASFYALPKTTSATITLLSTVAICPAMSVRIPSFVAFFSWMR